MSKKYDGPIRWQIKIYRCEDDGGDHYADRYTVGFRNFWYADNDGAYPCECSYDYLGFSEGLGISQWGENWGYDNDDDLIRWSSLPRNLRAHVLWRNLEAIKDSKVVEVEFLDEDDNRINLADYGIDIEKYLYKEGANV